MIHLRYSLPLHELDELQTKLQHRMRCFVLLAPKIYYIQGMLTGILYYATLCLLYDSLAKLNLVVTRSVI